MRISDLRFLIEVSHSKSITLTAEKMHISQQGLSRMITRLEQDLNVLLFHRSRQGITLTEAGQKTVIKAQEILNKYDELREELVRLTQHQTSPIKGELTLFHSHNSGTVVLPRALKLFKTKQPVVNLMIEENSPTETIKSIKEDPSTVGLINFPESYYQDCKKVCLYSDPDLSYKEVFRDDLVICIPKSWALSKKRNITINDLQKLPMVYFDTTQYAEIISLLFEEAEQPPAIFLKTLNNELFRQVMIDGLAMGVVSTLELSDFRLLKECTVQTPFRITLIYNWVCSANAPMSHQAQEFVKCLENSLKNIVD